jgi:hypothetical protein
MTYNQTRMNGVPMPLLMGCTKPTAIEIVECETKVVYDPVSQTVSMECGTVGTRSLRWRTTAIKLSSGQKSSKSDQKNEIDDQKSK